MKKQLQIRQRLPLVILLVFGVMIFSYGQNVDIPDPNFLRALIDEGVDTDGDGQISFEEAEAILKLDVRTKNIDDMTGIEAFINLTDLICFGNRLSKLDVTNLSRLTNLICYSNDISELDVSRLSNLATLGCTWNNISELDVSNLTNLTRLSLRQ